MEPSQALQVLTQACASVVADLPTHQRIQAALQVIEQVVKAAEEKQAVKEPAKK